MRQIYRLLGCFSLVFLMAMLLSCHREHNQPTMAARIIIDAQDDAKEIDPKIYSHFIENLGMCIYHGVWEDDPQVPVIYGGIRTDVVDLMKGIKPGVVRYPGGCFSDGYHFADGIGASRPIKPNLAWGYLNILDPRIGPDDPNTFGTDEFIKFVREISAEPYINVNFGTGTVEEATAWVSYCNAGVSNTTSIGKDSNGEDWGTAGDWAQKRQNNGSTEPYGVKYWGIANEIYGSHELGHTDSTSYGNRFIEFHNKMNAVDPNIKLVAVGADEAWNRTVLEIAWHYIDYLSIHAYYSGVFDSMVSGVHDNEEDFYSILSAAIVLENYIKSVGETIKDVTGSNDLKIALDEWNLWWNFQQLIHSEYSLRDGLFAALVFNVLHRNADIVGMANLAQMVNTIGMLNTSETDIFSTPIYFAFKLYTDHSLGLALTSQVETDSYDSEKLGNIPEMHAIPFLDCSATTNTDRSKMALIVVNRHYEEDIVTEIEIQNFQSSMNLDVWELNSAGPNDRNSYTDKDRVKISQKASRKVSSKFIYTFPAHSAIALILSPLK